MKLHLFNNKKCVIYGHDSTRLECERGGTIRIGATKINVTPGEPIILPPLPNGTYKPCFTDSEGTMYEGHETVIRGGRIASPPKEVIELFELRCKYETLEKGTEKMFADLKQSISEKFGEIDKEIEDLKSVFDTNSLNFII